MNLIDIFLIVMTYILVFAVGMAVGSYVTYKIETPMKIKPGDKLLFKEDRR